MNKPSRPNPIPAWTEAPAPDTPPEPGYDAWLATEIAAGMDDLKAGRVTALADLRKELGLE
jgi:hypothetical protein